MEKRILDLPLAKIRLDGGTQARARTRQEVVDDYTDSLRAGAVFPAVVTFFDDRDYWPGDGFHRIFAHKAAGRKTIAAEVRRGTVRDAILFAVGANVQHGLRPTPEDKRHAVGLLLADPEWSRWSNREIARRCGVSPGLVGLVRHERRQEARASAHGEQMRSCTRGGTTYPMNTAAIGAAPQEDLPAEEAAALRAETIRQALETAGWLREELAEDLGEEAGPALAHLDAFVGAVRALQAEEDSDDA